MGATPAAESPEDQSRLIKGLSPEARAELLRLLQSGPGEAGPKA